MLVGMKIDINPIPHIPENTQMFPAGAICFGVEYRVLNEQIVGDEYKGDMGRIRELQKEIASEKIDDSGVSIHVFGDDGLEYLRFDCFVEDPHYHYVMPHESFQRVVAFDTIANGDPLTWTMSALRQHLDGMLREAGGAPMADRMDARVVRAALDQVAMTADRLTGRGPDPRPMRRTSAGSATA